MLLSPGRACSSVCRTTTAVDRLSFFFLSSSSSSAHLPFPSTSRSRAFHSTPRRRLDAPRISYRIAASASGKGRRFHPAKNTHDFTPDLSAVGVATDTTDPAIRRKRRPDSGEDAFFVSRVGHEDPRPVAFAVADGVGGWAESKVDPADFSHALCCYMAQSALDWEQPAEQLRAKNLLQAGYDQVVADKSIRAGGCTASVGVGSPDGRVELANLGDSGSVLLRLAAVHHYSVPQTHGFNTPYQLSIIPPRMRKQASVFGGAYLEDFPRDAAVTNLHMQHGDVLLLATDGVFDNLNNQDILKLVTSRMVLTGAWTATGSTGIKPSDDLDQLTGPEGLTALVPPPSSSSEKSPKKQEDQIHTLQSLVAATIAGEAKLASLDFRRDGPFAKEAQRYYPGDWYRGGKVDDIAVVAVVAVDEGISVSSSS
ncbi:protein serine/threonine phosphatase 2C [Aspergillus steynii IBT 23096]|uniref:Protein phosphatase n=1 Tax=Aspergillus steynii IBT 23096 TaxID=1392250 RepID=A0A2I2FVU8_9EURO|nr:protein serine/threonine phosphatase 2C [Aspergillus steynii IBT 23096]PLB44758.1 protein serine/threonine phosphatase 2C [Aspergillus steynii IBT 23096]